MSESSLAGGAESCQYGVSTISGANSATVYPFDHVSPDQYPAFARDNDGTLSFPEKVSSELLFICD